VKSSPAFGFLVAAAVAVAIAAVVWIAMRGMGKDQVVAGEIDRTVMAEYCRLVGAGEFAKAWETCLSASYRGEVPLEKFVAAHEKRRAEVGVLGGCRLLRASLHRNLFSKTRELQLLYELVYPGGVRTEYATVNDADGSWRIEGTYHLGAGETFTFLLW
jgi:hypothetical protein